MILSVVNWERFQHYKDRNPPWIKLHRSLLTDYQFACLQDASKLHLALIWLLASQTNNEIPADENYLKNVLSLDSTPNLKELIDKGFLEVKDNASEMLAECKQVAMPETETETETDKEKTKAKKKAKTFQKPTREELISYAAERHFQHFDPDEFIDYYESNGWKVGKNYMKSWPHAVSRWERKNAKRSKTSGGTRSRSTAETVHNAYKQFAATNGSELDCSPVCQVPGSVRPQVVEFAPHNRTGESSDD